MGSVALARMSGTSRQRVLDTALRLFGERGYGATALQAIADELGLTKASVYYYFPAKGDLLEALAAPFLARLEAGITDPPDTSELSACRPLVGTYLAALADWSVVAAVLIGDRTVSAHPTAVRCRSLRGALRDLLAGAGSPVVGAITATCCLGAVQNAVFEFPHAHVNATRAAILDAAVRTLGGFSFGP
jgi:AcrR family transcriptional regulator